MVELPFKPLRSHTRSHSLFHYKLGETYSFLSLQDPRFKLSCYLSVFIFLSYKNNTIQAELTTRLHVFSFTHKHTHTHTWTPTHTVIYSSPGPFLYPLNPNCQTLNSTTAEQLGSTSVPTNPICKMPGLLWLAPNSMGVPCQLLFDCQTRISVHALQAEEWDAKPRTGRPVPTGNDITQ